ncbi:MAG TPA: YlxR family protein [Anaerolineae bacterium]|nr:YlxR family protein [Anaerolineae bacterium]
MLIGTMDNMINMAQQQQHKPRHTPLRTCVACRQKVEKRQLTRLVRISDADNEVVDSRVVIDPTGKRNGRGAYLCDKPACWQRAIKHRILDIALKIELTDAEREHVLAFSVSAETQAVIQRAKQTHV